MMQLNSISTETRLVVGSIYGRMTLCVTLWRQLSARSRIRAERRRIGRTLRESFDTLCDTKCRALKTTGVFGTDHGNLEAAIVHLARALDDYHDGG